MSVIVPTIMARTVEEYKATWKKYYNVAERVQIDVADADFAAEASLSLQDILASGGWPSDRQVDLHIMSANPQNYVPLLLQKRPHLVIFHAEVEQDLLTDFQPLREAGIKVGVAFMKKTYPKTYEKYLQAVDHALIFNGNKEDLGSHAKVINMLLLEKVGIIRSINPALEIGWDGGATMESVHQMTVGGVNVINVGSALSTADDAAKAYADLVAEANREGVI
jgi:ribulose-phosphate 3-epimerase